MSETDRAVDEGKEEPERERRFLLRDRLLLIRHRPICSPRSLPSGAVPVGAPTSSSSSEDNRLYRPLSEHCGEPVGKKVILIDERP
jgi:hypothetical protein